ncbi:MAG: hypothetical protein JWN40_4692 [Phycisphaerales bacterium]|nr:hypothetical protein [Phycisphaerales bacterium]
MRSNVKSILAAMVVLLLLSSSSFAAILVNSTVTPGTGDYAGFDIIRYFAGFDAATSDEATQGAKGVQTLSIKMSTTGTGTFKVGFTSASGFPPRTTANVYGQTFGTSSQSDAILRSASSSTDQATYEAFGSMGSLRDPLNNGFSVQALEISSDGTTFTPVADKVNGIQNPTAVNQAMFGNLKGLRVDGFLQNPPGSTAFDPTAKTAAFTNAPGQGALIGLVVVPHGQAVRAQGSIQADRGGPSFFDTAGVPEPTSIGLLCIGAVGILGRRRTK